MNWGAEDLLYTGIGWCRRMTADCVSVSWQLRRARPQGNCRKLISGRRARHLRNSEACMCLGIPGKVVKTFQEHDVLMGKVDFSGVVKQVCLEHVPQVKIGQYVLVHVGFALSAIDEKEAMMVFDFLEKMNQLDELESPSQ